MEQIIVTRRNGTTYPLVVKKEATAITQAQQSWGLLGDDLVQISIESPFPQQHEIGDWISVFGRIYTLNQLPRVRKSGVHKYAYDLTFEGVQYDLLRAFYDVTIETTGNTLQDVQGDALTGNLKRFATVLIANANRVFPDKWKLGTCPDTASDKTLTFGDGDNCLAVYQNLCKTFDVEANISVRDGVRTIDFVKRVGTTHPFVFEFGKGKGLYALDRQNVDSSNIVTRLKVFGSADNITNKYRANRLCLPGKSKAQSFIEEATAIQKYGIHEARKVFEDIKPTFNGRISELVAGSVLKFKDASMFDLNALEADGRTTKYLVAGVSAKIHFNTGNLAGYEFDIHKYDHATRTFTLKKLTDDRGAVFPSATSVAFQFSVGDEYKILDVTLPEQYQTDAERRLQEQGNEYYRQNSQPKVKYGLSISREYLMKLFADGTTSLFTPGDYINIKDESIGVDKAVRIQSLQRSLFDVYNYTLTIADVAESNITTRVISELLEIDKITTLHQLKDPTRAKANWRSSREVLDMVFDPEGDYYTDKIKPNSIDTLSLSVGAKSMQFALQNVVFDANYQGQKNVVKVSEGTLTHYTIEDSPRTWIVAPAVVSLEEDNTPYYILARCSKSGDSATIVFSKSPIRVEQEAGMYHFWIGVVNSVDETLQARSMSLTYGFSTINGRFIKTGRIESADGNTYFDLDAGEIRGNILFKGGKTLDNAVSDIIKQPISEAKSYADGKTNDALAEVARRDTALKTELEGKVTALLSSVSTIQGDLQRQIDKQVEMFWGEKPPTGRIGWKEADDAKHEGDTYTVRPPEGVTITPQNAKQYPNVGKSWRWHGNGWIEIADTDVTRALALAGEAKASADGKVTHFRGGAIPTGYKQGDLWTLTSSWNGFKQGSILTATQDEVIGQYNPAHWKEEVRYTDDTAIRTLSIGGRNYIRNSSQEFKMKGLHKFLELSDTLKAGSAVTISAYIIIHAQPKVEGDKARLKFLLTPATWSENNWGLAELPTGVSEGIVQKTITLDRDVTRLCVYPNQYYLKEDKGAEVTVKWIKLEYGNKATDYTEAPEDVADALKKVETDGTAKANQALSDAKTYANTKTQEANTYTNSKANEVKTYASQQASTALNDAKAFAREEDEKREKVLRAFMMQDYLRQVIKDGSTLIKGGLLATNVIALKSTNGKVSSYIDGNEANNIAFAAGVTDAFTANEKRAVEITHDGNARFGQMHLNGHDGVLSFAPIGSAESYLNIGGVARPLDSLLGGTLSSDDRTGSVEFRPPTINSDAEITNTKELIGGMNITKDGATIKFSGSYSISVDQEYYENDTSTYPSRPTDTSTLKRVNAIGILEIKLIKKGERGDEDKAQILYVSKQGNDTARGAVNFVASTTIEKGVYKVVATCTHKGASVGRSSTISTANIETKVTNKSTEVYIGKDSMYAVFGRENFLHVSEQGTTIKGRTDMPGVLAAGIAKMTGIVQNAYGAKVNRQGYDYAVCEWQRDNSYKVYHSIGHSNYSVQVTVFGDSRDAGCVMEISDYYFRCCFYNPVDVYREQQNFTYLCIGQNTK
nr:MAG TPA: Protein gp18.1, prophage tail protein gp18.7A [Caudoviricetes sp.]